jgi:hypothetical protein
MHQAARIRGLDICAEISKEMNLRKSVLLDLDFPFTEFCKVNFRFTEFSEVRLKGVLRSPRLPFG